MFTLIIKTIFKLGAFITRVVFKMVLDKLFAKTSQIEVMTSFENSKRISQTVSNEKDIEF